ncbi:hypothetical protein N658DRAFT_447053 [Parathielavia hyrcaniae]|uniref:Putative lipoate-protein ligase A n=1 Tax=Parathielavia hyrcaniae TaxID=113614 RepID=A0AAN6Q7Q9_9PEZI|nr:hypothetical protein N658DRAFT_447053 [Parathielavia hyrcaniae]
MALSCHLRALTLCLTPTIPRSHFNSISLPSTPHQPRYYTQNLTRPAQIYRSTSTDPYLNLSIEHHLLQRSHPDSTVLFLYTNRPSVVIGRNQNPWLEVNLHALRQGLPPPPRPLPTPSPPSQNLPQPKPIEQASRNDPPIALVRRRSGGGTVFHDAGNANWSVICPPPAFDRDKHAEMVVRALRRLLSTSASASPGKKKKVRVNERHDIVMDDDDHLDEEGVGGRVTKSTFKVSGSAYKLTRSRSLHHGTCLLASENLGRVGRLLRSPAEGYIKARGVESVRSPIRNVGLRGDEFADAVVREFRSMYGNADGREVFVGEEEALANEEVVKGLRELTSPDWVFGQTPLFTFSTHPTEDDPRERPEMAHKLPEKFQAQFTVRHGEIQAASVSGLEYHYAVDDASQDVILSNAMVEQRLHHIKDWRSTLRQASPVPVDAEGVGEWLNHMFGIQTLSHNSGGAMAEAVIKAISDTAVGRFLDRHH